MMHPAPFDRPLPTSRALRAGLFSALAAMSLVACGTSDSGVQLTASTTTTAATTTSGESANNYTTTPLPPIDTAPTTTNASLPSSMDALRPDGIGLLRIGMPFAEFERSGLLTNRRPSCDDGAEEQFDLAIPGLSGTAFVTNDEIQGFSITAGHVDGAGVIGETMDAFVAASAGTYGWDLDESFAGAYDIWIGTLTNRTTGDTIEVAVNPSTKVVEEAAAPFIGLCE